MSPWAAAGREWPWTSAKGNRYVLVMVDCFSRWTEACPLSDKTAISVADAFFSYIVCRFGMPSVIHSDQRRDLGSAAPLIRWRVWGFGVHPSIPCDYTKVTLVPVYYNFVLKVSLLVASVLGFACQVVRGFYHICSLFRARLCWGGGVV